jgi:hypothetical protein
LLTESEQEEGLAMVLIPEVIEQRDFLDYYRYHSIFGGAQQYVGIKKAGSNGPAFISLFILAIPFLTSS